MIFIKSIFSKLFPPGIGLQVFVDKVDNIYVIQLREINLNNITYDSEDDNCGCKSYSDCLC